MIECMGIKLSNILLQAQKQYNLLLEKYLTFFRVSIFLNLFDFEPRISFKLLINIKVVTSKNLSNIFQSLLMFYYIIKPSKSVCFVLIMQKYI